MNMWIEHCLRFMAVLVSARAAIHSDATKTLLDAANLTYIVLSGLGFCSVCLFSFELRPIIIKP